jgi:hypothetical protein
VTPIPATDLHTSTEDEALAAVDEFIGTAADWKSALIRYRMASEWQRDWLVEVGHWLLDANRHGFADAIPERLKGVRDQDLPDKDANDNAHKKLNTELAEAMTLYYFKGVGWSFHAHDVTAPGEDIDLELAVPSGQLVALQVKAPDTSGYNDIRSSIGGSDEHIRLALAKAAGQLPRPARQPSIVVLCAQSSIPLCAATYVVERLLHGPTSSGDGIPAVILRRSALGKFASEWTHVGAVVALNYLRSEVPSYSSTVLLNPWAEPAARCDRGWFPRSRILWLDGSTFRWVGTPPFGSVADGTMLVDE